MKKRVKMSVKTREELLNFYRDNIANSDSDNSVTFLEDLSDTLGDLETKSGSAEQWKEKYEENDKNWRKKYTDRFYSNDTENNEDNEENEEQSDEKQKLHFEDLFSVKE